MRSGHRLDFAPQRSQNLLPQTLAGCVLASACLAGCGSAPPEPAAPSPETAAPSPEGAALQTSPPAAHRAAPKPHQLASPEGEGSAPAETPRRAHLTPPSAAAELEPRRSSGMAAAIRTYLARQFLYKDWYPNVREVEVRRHVAFVSTWRLKLSEGKATPRRICAAIISSHRVRKAWVQFGRGFTVGC
jgi:hypothetical protein